MILKAAVDPRDLSQSVTSKEVTAKTQRTFKGHLRFSITSLDIKILRHLISSNCGF